MKRLPLLLLLALASPAATNFPPATPTTHSAAVSDVEKAFKALLEQDQDALDEIDTWIVESQGPGGGSTSIASVTLRERILQRTKPVREAYESFIRKHPSHAKAHLAYASFLMELAEEPLAVEHMEKARALDPKDPAIWNNLANHYGHRGPAVKAFEYYAKAIELNPAEPVYYQNLATTVFLFRVDAREFYHITEPQVFDKALDLYRLALKLDPTNFLLASDLAQTYYGIRPPLTNSPAERAAAQATISSNAIAAWKSALQLASDEVQRQGVSVHMARHFMLSGLNENARLQLQSVTNAAYADLKARLLRAIDRKEDAPRDPLEPTPPPGAVAPPPTATNR